MKKAVLLTLLFAMPAFAQSGSMGTGMGPGSAPMLQQNAVSPSQQQQNNNNSLLNDMQQRSQPTSINPDQPSIGRVPTTTPDTNIPNPTNTNPTNTTPINRY